MSKMSGMRQLKKSTADQVELQEEIMLNEFLPIRRQGAWDFKRLTNNSSKS
jgi:hypothetical protein